jgi:TPP-dependent pyruvate/acetoin dehydrogenase alpha subunit
MRATSLLAHTAVTCYPRKTKFIYLLHIFQEACCVGMQNAIDKDDSVITAYRCHGWTFMRGIAPKSVLCELTGIVLLLWMCNMTLGQ